MLMKLSRQIVIPSRGSRRRLLVLDCGMPDEYKESFDRIVGQNSSISGLSTF